MRLPSPKHIYRRTVCFIRLLTQPTSQALAERMTWRFCTLLIGEAIGIFVFFVWLLSAELGPWGSFFGLLLFVLLMPLCTLQLISRLSPKWGESITFKYLAVIGIVIGWLSTMIGRSMVAALFHVAPSDFPNALAASSILATGIWISAIAVAVSIALEMLTLAPILLPHKARRLPRHHAGTVSLAFIAIFHSAYLGSLVIGKVSSEEIRKVIVARIGWESDLLPAPTSCLNETQRSLSGEWKVFPRSVGEEKTLLVRSATDMPEKAFWRFEPEELERFASFDIEQAECSIKQAPVDQLKSVEAKQEAQKEYRKRTERYRGISPIATVEIEK